MTILITLTVAGADSGPFDLYSDVDNYTTPFQTGVSRSALLAGHLSTTVPDGTTIVRVKSTGVCTNYIDIVVVTTTTTTSTTSTTSSTTTTTTTTTAVPEECTEYYNNTSSNLSVTYVPCGGSTQITAIVTPGQSICVSNNSSCLGDCGLLTVLGPC